MAHTHASATTAPERAPSRDALELLEADHNHVRDLFDQFAKARSDTQKAALARQICTELTIHAQIEEEIFYPAVRAAIDEDELMDEAEADHALAKALIAQIEASRPGDDKFEANVKVLGEHIKHHAQEEEWEMFSRARKSDLDLDELGEVISFRKAELQAE